jgi:hypothetical protein
MKAQCASDEEEVARVQASPKRYDEQKEVKRVLTNEKRTIGAFDHSFSDE